ncbi:MAG: helix-turn-helix domain-containing protein [Moraxellaceae bacterium]|nr:helix-turn-helix domain-containing protein [Moraxellaceae bacterium]MDZ4297650.1 helix-turn-helix domain-containing protein [Moraxellaceae bacterium]MDZ4385923.1 helix-turn-helix domain-containing protein [Moraxellaceae bacterium]
MLMITFLPYLDSYPNIGAIFSKQRHQLGVSLDDACRRLGVSRFYVIGLESNRLDLLPTVEETRNLITRYNQLLALDSQSVLAMFNTWLANCPMPEQTALIANTHSSLILRGLKAAAIAALLLLYPASTTDMLSNTMVFTHTYTEAEADIATLDFTSFTTISENTTTASNPKVKDTPSAHNFAPKPYSDTRNADDVERDRLFFLQEQIRLGLEPVAKPYKG